MAGKKRKINLIVDGEEIEKTATEWAAFFYCTYSTMSRIFNQKNKVEVVAWGKKRIIKNMLDSSRPDECQPCGNYEKCLNNLMDNRILFPVLYGRKCQVPPEEKDVKRVSNLGVVAGSYAYQVNNERTSFF